MLPFHHLQFLPRQGFSCRARRGPLGLHDGTGLAEEGSDPASKGACSNFKRKDRAQKNTTTSLSTMRYGDEEKEIPALQQLLDGRREMRTLLGKD